MRVTNRFRRQRWRCDKGRQNAREAYIVRHIGATVVALSNKMLMLLTSMPLVLNN
jgi:hypothetical protein